VIAQFPKYHILRGSVAYSGENDPIAAITQELRSLDYVEMTTIDGVRLDFEDGWILVRRSGTEPKMRITAEARDAAMTKRLYEKALVIVKRHI
jgi:phosphoglucosamine mutase